MKPFWLSFIAGLVLACAGIVTLTFSAVTRRLEQERTEWALTPTVVLADNVPAERALSWEDLSQRSIPARFITSSMVLPADVERGIGHAPSLSLQAGGILLWAAFAAHSATDACFVTIAPKVRAAGITARDATVTRFGEGMGVPLPAPEPSPAPKGDASGHVSVVVLTKDVPKGQVLEESMLAAGKLPSSMVTASHVPAGQLRNVVGARSIVAMQARDALMWQMLDDAKRPRQAASCIFEAATAQEKARDRTTREESAAYVRGQEAH